MAEYFGDTNEVHLDDETNENFSVSNGEKKRRTNYRKPENAAKLNAAVNALIMQKEDPNGPQDIRTVSKLFNIPYNTLRDNYIRVTTGTIRSSKRVKKRKLEDNPNPHPSTVESNIDPITSDSSDSEDSGLNRS